MAIACCSVITIIKDAKKKGYEKYRFFKNVYFFFYRPCKQRPILPHEGNLPPPYAIAMDIQLYTLAMVR